MALKVLTACGAGMGCCQIIALKLKKTFQEMGIEANITHGNVSNAKSTATNYDVLVCGATLVNNFKSAESKGVVVIGLKNLTSEKEMKEKLQAAIDSGTLKI